MIVLSDLFVISFAVDIISAIEFDKSGDHLATGDRGGRVVLFERTDMKEVSCACLSDYTILTFLEIFFLFYKCFAFCTCGFCIDSSVTCYLHVLNLLHWCSMVEVEEI